MMVFNGNNYNVHVTVVLVPTDVWNCLSSESMELQ